MTSLHDLGKPVSKRRAEDKTLSSRKKAKTHHLSLHDLPWKTIGRPGFGGDDGILEFEEVDGVEVVYEETEGGRVARFNVSRAVPSILILCKETLLGY
jgi:ATP-dependent RNA helicase DDX24/MAK5